MSRRRERVFFLIKPDGVTREREIMAILEPWVRVAAARRFSRAPMKRMAALYGEHRGKVFFPWLMTFFRGRPVKAFILEARPGKGTGAGLHRRVAKLVGATNPREAAPGTIRALSDDDIRLSMRQGRAIRNLAHRSLTPADSRREAALFFHDVPSPGADRFTPGKLTADLVSPLAARPPVKALGGIFFDERLGRALSSLGLVPAGSRLKGSLERPGRRPGSATLDLAFIQGGRRRRRTISLQR